MMMMMVMMISV